MVQTRSTGGRPWKNSTVERKLGRIFEGAPDPLQTNKPDWSSGDGTTPLNNGRKCQALQIFGPLQYPCFQSGMGRGCPMLPILQWTSGPTKRPDCNPGETGYPPRIGPNGTAL